MKVLAQTATADGGRGTVSIDGVTLPWFIAEEGVEIEHRDGILVAHVPILIESAATTITGSGRRGELFDPVLGNVRLWAIESVRRQFRDTYPDLEV